MIYEGSEEGKADAEEPDAEPDAAPPYDATADDFDRLARHELDQKRDVACFPELNIDVIKSALKSLEPDSCFIDATNEELNPIVEWRSIDYLIDKKDKEKFGCPVTNNRSAVCAWGEVVEDAIKAHTGDMSPVVKAQAKIKSAPKHRATKL